MVTPSIRRWWSARLQRLSASTPALMAVLALVLAGIMLGCMEEDTSQTEQNPQQNSDAGGEPAEEGTSIPPMDIEIANLEWEWVNSTEGPERSELSVSCDAINYGGPGYATIRVVANASETSLVLEQRIYIDQNEQLHLDFSGKIDSEPTNISVYARRERLDILEPRVEDLDVEVTNLYYDVLGVDDTYDIVIYCSAINYGQPGYITVVMDVSCPEVNKTLEERVHLDTDEQLDMEFRVQLPSLPQNLSTSLKRPQVD